MKITHRQNEEVEVKNLSYGDLFHYPVNDDDNDDETIYMFINHPVNSNNTTRVVAMDNGLLYDIGIGVLVIKVEAELVVTS